MKIHKTLALIILLFSGNLFAQNNVWLLGNKNLGSTKSSFKINFSGGFPVVTEAESQIGFHESSSVVSDEKFILKPDTK